MMERKEGIIFPTRAQPAKVRANDSESDEEGRMESTKFREFHSPQPSRSRGGGTRQTKKLFRAALDASSPDKRSYSARPNEVFRVGARELARGEGFAADELAADEISSENKLDE